MRILIHAYSHTHAKTHKHVHTGIHFTYYYTSKLFFNDLLNNCHEQRDSETETHFIEVTLKGMKSRLEPKARMWHTHSLRLSWIDNMMDEWTMHSHSNWLQSNQELVLTVVDEICLIHHERCRHCLPIMSSGEKNSDVVWNFWVWSKIEAGAVALLVASKRNKDGLINTSNS